MPPQRQVAIIGAGFIAGAHVAALSRRKDVAVVAIVDPAAAKAQALATQSGARAFPDAASMLAQMRPDAAHVLTPPPLHRASAEPLLAAGVGVLLEKPMAETSPDCAALIAAARASGAALVVNHNFTRHPAYLEARKLVMSGRFGRPRRVQMRYAAPLRQLASRQFGHWMFASARNLLLEQAVHPLSQIDDLLGPILDVKATPGPALTPAEGIELRPDWMFNLFCRDGLAQLQIALGATFPSWTLSVLLDDGVVDADMFEGRVIARAPHASIQPLDAASRNAGAGFAGLAASARGLGGFALELARLRPASDGFNRSMANSIAAFHDALSAGEKPVSDAGQRLVGVCERAAQAVDAAPATPARLATSVDRADVAVLGGTGFIGAHLVSRLIADGKRVAVMARNVRRLPALYSDERVRLFEGSTSDVSALSRALAGTRAVVNLAHGGGGATRDEIMRNMVGGAAAAAEATRAAGGERYLFVSSSAALYLGDPAATVAMETPADPLPGERADYARAKILAERAVAEVEGANSVILRPAIVVGKGSSPFHSALGAFENETHCAGWNDGRNPLPFVLASDVADAIALCVAADLAAVRGKTFNLVGDVRWSARKYIEELALATGRPLKFHPTSEPQLMAAEWTKWAVKKAAGRKDVRRPSARDIRSRGMLAAFDTCGEKRILAWSPNADEAEFRRQAILPHAR